MTQNVIVNSFKACKSSSSTNGSDNGFIHCLKPGGVAQIVHQNSGDCDDDTFASGSEAEFEANLQGTG